MLFKQFSDFLNATAPEQIDLKNELTMLQRRFRSLQAQERRLTVSPGDAKIESNQIVLAMLKLLTELTKATTLT